MLNDDIGPTTGMKRPGENQSSALSRIEVVVLVATSSLLVCLGLLWLHGARFKAWGICCNCNLKQIGLAFKEWSLDHEGRFPMQVSTTNGGAKEFAESDDVASVFRVISNEVSTPKVLVCPADAARRSASDFGASFSNVNISYFVSLDAVDSRLAMFLSGDRNITNGSPLRRGILILTTNQNIGWTTALHNGKGNLGFTDGSVWQLSSSGLNDALQNSGATTNRLVIP